MSDTNGAVFGGLAGFITLCGTIYAAINHKHIRAKCCGRTFEMEIDVNPIEDFKKSTTDKKNRKVHPDVSDHTEIDIKSHPTPPTQEE